jgi:hypothetical protein
MEEFMKAILEIVHQDLKDNVDEKTKATPHRFLRRKCWFIV